jgi:hypothetical protein
MTVILYIVAVAGGIIALQTGSTTALGMGIIAALAAIARGSK